ncbi:MAG: phosphatidate cytidylyltransferase [bacterium]|nr:phosphatidate cytidylyltransferase [bacterium]
MLSQRVASALIFGPLLVLGVVLGGPLLAVMVLLIAVLGLREYAGLLRPGEGRMLAVVAYPAAALLIADAWLGTPPAGLVFLLAVASSLLYSLASSRGPGPADTGLTIFGLVYLPWFIGFILRTRALPGGLILALYTLFGTWAFDTVGYFVGVRWGRRRLCPAVSPGKSWEGTLAGLAGAVLVAAVANRWLGWPPAAWVALGLVAGLAAQLGDLLESAFKRHAGVKDAGNLIPGHGGVLDRFDSLLLVAPTVFYLAVLLGG